MARHRIIIKGRVQGVGFRPFLYNLAHQFGLKGFVLNTSEGVIVEVEGEAVAEFLDTMKASPPPLAKIEDIHVEVLQKKGYSDFRILSSKDEGSFTHVSPDVSTCEECLKEMMDPQDRRYLYPFINCTNCGPRYSITLRVPYDRPNTTMAAFKMCRMCEQEYHDPSSRRFHAQPNACPECGPSLELVIPSERYRQYMKLPPIEAVIRVLSEGGIVAIKGLGGFHIACNAEDRDAVVKLRQRKRRGNKPFALMAPDIETIQQYCYITQQEKELLLSGSRPIVLLRKKHSALPEEIAPQNRYLGFMLPYTPLHHLLFNYPVQQRGFSVLVMTSGNLSEEPIVHKNTDALNRLKHIVDAYLLHNRDIFMRVDDSVLNHEVFIRRARGFVPEAIRLSAPAGEILAVGADLKNTFTLTKDGYAIVSQHIGDMENFETLEFFEEVFQNLSGLYRVRPERLAADLHPEYFSRRWADRQALPVQYYQHHYAHAASVMAEYGLKGPVLAVILDGTGYGTDGRIWGSEFLIVDLNGFKRFAHMRYIPLPSGEVAIKEPWRVAMSVLHETFQQDTRLWLQRLGYPERIPEEKIQIIHRMLLAAVMTVPSCGCGRLFDAVASLTGLKDINTFEAEAPIALESVFMEEVQEGYEFSIDHGRPFEIDYRPVIEAIVRDLRDGLRPEEISSRFHNSVVKMIQTVVEMMKRDTGINTVVLSGGVFQNLVLLKKTLQVLQNAGFEVYVNRRLPPNDACISLGQAYLSLWRQR